MSIRTSPDYKGTLTGTLLHCEGLPGREPVPNCRLPTSNDVNHLDFTTFRFDKPNGNVGPNTSVTYQVLTSSDMVGTGRCSNGGDVYSVLSDVNILRIDDESGNTLYIGILHAGTGC